MKNKKDIIRVIALVTVLLMLAVIPLMFAGCSANTAATNAEDREAQYAQYAIISMPNGELIEAEVEGWYFWGDGMVRIITDDATYVTHGVNVAMITK